MKCFYHNDNDGKASAFCVAAWAHGQDDPSYGKVFIPMEYGDPFPMGGIEPHEEVWILDYSIARDEMTYLLILTEHITWIDHHKTAIERYDGYPFPVRGIRASNGEDAGCTLTYKYLNWWTDGGLGPEDFDATPPVHLAVPEALELVADRDVWRWRHGERTSRFFYGSGLYDLDPTGDFWRRITGVGGQAFLDKVLGEGDLIEAYRSNQTAQGLKRAWRDTLWGKRCLILPGGRSTDSFGAVQGKLPPSDVEVYVGFSHDGRQFTVGLYSDTVDVSEIAKTYPGGGGHRGAAGFQCDTLPFRRP